jgi:hypothetical protein
VWAVPRLDVTLVYLSLRVARAQVQLRRFFSWTVAFKHFDPQWSGAAFVLEFLHDMLGEWTDEPREAIWSNTYGLRSRPHLAPHTHTY